MRAKTFLLALVCVVLAAIVWVAIVWACDPPGGGINSPPGGATVAGTTSVQVSVTSETEVKGVDLYVDGNLLDSVSKEPYTYSWDTTKKANGEHELSAKVRATDRPDGSMTPIKVTVKN
jgi:hypothetical protein